MMRQKQNISGLCCGARGDLSDRLEKPHIYDMDVYFIRNKQSRMMPDSLVLIIYKNDLENEAEKFKTHFPKGLFQSMRLNSK